MIHWYEYNDDGSITLDKSGEPKKFQAKDKYPKGDYQFRDNRFMRISKVDPVWDFNE